MPGPSLPHLALASLLILGACVDAPTPPAVSGGRIASAPDSNTGGGRGPVTTFDGIYRGTAKLNADRSRRCMEGPPQLEATVRQGRAGLVINPSTRQTLQGTVGEDGSVRMVDIVDRGIATTGIFTEEGFSGMHRSGVCTYTITLQREG